MSRRRSQISVIPGDRSLPYHKATLFTQGIPATTKAAFKAACAKRGVSMRDALIRLMRGFVQSTEEHHI